MNEYVSVVSRFADDLYALGISRPLRDEAIRLYMKALFEQSREAWYHFYRHVVHALERWSGDPFDTDAASRLSALIEDDFGKQAFNGRVRAPLRRMLLRQRHVSLSA